MVKKLIPEDGITWGDIEKAGHSIYLFYYVSVSKVKIPKKPKFEMVKLRASSKGSGSRKASGDETGADTERAMNSRFFKFKLSVVTKSYLWHLKDKREK